MEYLVERLPRPQGFRQVLVGFLLALFSQSACHSIIRPTLGRFYGDVFGYLYTFSLPVWRECAFFAAIFLTVAALIPKSYSRAAWGIAAGGLLNVLLFVAALYFRS